MKVLSYLDCGCAIMEDGSRHLCPSCESPPSSGSMPSGAEMIHRERERQISKERFDADHDDDHRDNEIVRAATAYLVHYVQRGWKLDAQDDCLAREYRTDRPNEFWPWSREDWKPKGAIEDLVRAGALIAAEIDRLQREARASNKQ
jgi:hypothetical protein